MPTQLHEPAYLAGGASARPGLNAGRTGRSLPTRCVVPCCGRELRFRKLRVLSFATPQVRPCSGLWTGRELAAPRPSLRELGHLTANRRSHRLRRRHKAQAALVSGGSGGPGGGVLVRRRRV